MERIKEALQTDQESVGSDIKLPSYTSAEQLSGKFSTLFHEEDHCHTG